MKIKSAVFFFIISFVPAFFLIIILTPLEFFFLDTKFIISTISYRTYDISDFVAIILIDAESESFLSIPIEGKGWREHDPVVISLLNEHKARVIAFDIEFSGEQTRWDESLAAGYLAAGNVITCEILEGSTDPRFSRSLYAIGNASAKNYFGLPRKINLFPDNTGQRAFSYEVTTAFVRFLTTSVSPSDSGSINPLLLQKKIQRATSDGEFWINYQYPDHYFPIYSYKDILAAQNGRIDDPAHTPLSIFKNKIVLIAKDFQKDKIPLPNNFGIKVFGGMVHAYGIQTLLDGSQLRQLPRIAEIILLICLLFVVHTILYRIRGSEGFLYVLIICLIIYIAHLILFQTLHYWLLFGPPFIGSIISIISHGIYKRYAMQKEFRHINTQVKRLTQFNSQLEETGKLKDILTDTLVHDIKNAIAAVEGSLYFITEKYKEDSQSLEIFHAASIACTDIINLSSNLLDVRKIEENKFEFQKEPCSIAQITDIVSRFTHYPLFYEKKIKVDINPGPESRIFNADMYLMEQIVHNLLNNALKYTPAHGSIAISFEQQQERGFVITFFNSGRPISDEVKESIFEKYKRGKRKRSKYSKGLGLYFCKLAMEMQGGSICLETDNNGNYFKLIFGQ